MIDYGRRRVPPGRLRGGLPLSAITANIHVDAAASLHRRAIEDISLNCRGIRGTGGCTARSQWRLRAMRYRDSSPESAPVR